MNSFDAQQDGVRAEYGLSSSDRASDALYSLLEGRGGEKLQRRYRAAHSVVSKLDYMVTQPIEDFIDDDIVTWNFENLFLYSTDGNTKSLLPILDGISVEEKLMIFEACRLIEILPLTYKSPEAPMSVRGMVSDLLNGERLSVHAKRALVCLDSNGYGDMWACSADGGAHIAPIVELQMTQMGPVGPESIFVESYLRGLFRNGIADARTVKSQNEILIGLRNEVVTKELLGILTGNSPNYSDAPILVKQHIQILAAHARRLYNFDEEIPDEWVLKAIS